MNLFVYGTLMDEALVAELTGQRFRKERAQLPGYRKVAPRGAYGYIVADAEETVDGLVLRDVDADALRKIDRYEDEGQLYRRMEVVVIVAGREERAMAYVGIVAAP